MCAKGSPLQSKTHAVFKLEMSEAALLDFVCRFRNCSRGKVCSIWYESLPPSILSSEPFSIFGMRGTQQKGMISHQDFSFRLGNFITPIVEEVIARGVEIITFLGLWKGGDGWNSSAKVFKYKALNFPFPFPSLPFSQACGIWKFWP